MSSSEIREVEYDYIVDTGFLRCPICDTIHEFDMRLVSRFKKRINDSKYSRFHRVYNLPCNGEMVYLISIKGIEQKAKKSKY